MKLVVDGGKLKIEANRTELIGMAQELLRKASEPEHEFQSACCSATQFVFDKKEDGVESCSFSRVK